MFKFLEQRAKANKNIAAHRSHRRLVLELHCDASIEYALIDDAGIKVTTEAGGDAPDIILKASLEAWTEHRLRAPRPGFQALSTMRRAGHLNVAGDVLAVVLHRPDVHGGEIAGALMNGVMAPQSPQAQRWETMWHYMQSGPGAFLGDLHYYFRDGDLRNGGTDGLDAEQCPVYLLSGEYDPSATPEMGQALADEIGAAHFEVMEEMGHFPMSENPERFRAYLLPVLDKIIGAEESVASASLQPETSKP